MSSYKDIRTLAGQLLIFGFDGVEFDAALQKQLSEHRPGGLILFRRNLVDAAQTHALLAQAQKASADKLFLCIDMEGGDVDRLKDMIAPAPSAASVYASCERSLYRLHGRTIGDEIRTLGFNVDFAPVSDLAFAASHQVMGSRVVSDKPAQATIYVREFLRGLKEARVLGCGKHYPGLGEANLDTHQKLPSVDKPWRKLWQEDLAPYRTLHAHMPFIMVAHCNYPQVTGDDMPASLSRKWMTEILRRRMGYKGLIISDDLEMGGVLAAASVGEAAVETIRAGADVFLVCHKAERVAEAYEAVVRECESNARFRQQAQTAARRILAIKRNSPAINRRMAPKPTPERVEKLRKQLWALDESLRLSINAKIK